MTTKNTKNAKENMEKFTDEYSIVEVTDPVTLTARLTGSIPALLKAGWAGEVDWVTDESFYDNSMTTYEIHDNIDDIVMDGLSFDALQDVVNYFVENGELEKMV